MMQLMEQTTEYKNPFLEDMETEFKKYENTLHEICHKYYNPKREYRFSYEDFFGYASIGFVKAYKAYNPDPLNKTKFISYLYSMVLGEVRRALRDFSHDFHIPRTIKELIPKVNHLILNLAYTDPVKIAEAADAPIELVLETIEYVKYSRLESLEAPIPENWNMGNEITLKDMISDSTQIFPSFRDIEIKELKEKFHDLMLNVLNEKEYQAVHYVWYEGKKQSDAGKIIGCSQMHVSRLIRSAIKKLKEYNNYLSFPMETIA